MMFITYKANRARVILAIALVIGGMQISCDSGNPVTLNEALGDAGMLTTHAPVNVLSTSISAGGEISIDSPGMPLHGLTLKAPRNSLAMTMPVTITYADIRSHRFGRLFEPVTPLISIYNGRHYARAPLRLRIPLTGLNARFPVAFLYDRASGTLEALSPLARTDTTLDVMIRRFGHIVVSAVPLETLKHGHGYDTQFNMGVHGWAMYNWGSFVKPGGLFSGMSLGAWHYYEVLNAPTPLVEYFDNDRYDFRTPSLGWDDVTAMKYCSELQSYFEEATSIWREAETLDMLRAVSVEDHFWSASYAMLVTGRLQPMYIASLDDEAVPAQVYFIYAYHLPIGGARLMTYDPNSVMGEIYIRTSSWEFNYYTANNHADYYTAKHDFYDHISLIPISTLIDVRGIDRIWRRVEDGSVGAGQYPDFDLWAVPVEPDSGPKVKLLDAIDSKVTYLPFERFTVEIAPRDTSLQFRLWAYVTRPRLEHIERQEPADVIMLTRPGEDNLVGILVLRREIVENRARFDWSGFRWHTVVFQPPRSG